MELKVSLFWLFAEAVFGLEKETDEPNAKNDDDVDPIQDDDCIPDIPVEGDFDKYEEEGVADDQFRDSDDELPRKYHNSHIIETNTLWVDS